MLERLTRLFVPDDKRRKAHLTLARLLTQIELNGLSYRENVEATRRKSESHAMAMGAWIIPYRESAADGRLALELAMPVVTYDFRRTGVGVLSRAKIEFESIAVAIPDVEGVWNFFDCRVCHQSGRPGGWTLAGLQISQLLIPDPHDVTLFRRQIGDVPEADVESEVMAARW